MASERPKVVVVSGGGVMHSTLTSVGMGVPEVCLVDWDDVQAAARDGGGYTLPPWAVDMIVNKWPADGPTLMRAMKPAQRPEYGSIQHMNHSSQ